jgi:hypothetical protein
MYMRWSVELEGELECDTDWFLLEEFVSLWDSVISCLPLFSIRVTINLTYWSVTRNFVIDYRYEYMSTTSLLPPRHRYGWLYAFIRSTHEGCQHL